MRTLLLSTTAIIAAVALAFGLSPSPAQDTTDQHLGSVHFETSCNEIAQRRFDRAMRYQHSFWYRQAKEVFAFTPEQPTRPDTSIQRSAWPRGDSESKGDRRQDRAGTGLY